MKIQNRRLPAALAGLAMLLALPEKSHAGLCDLFKCKSCAAPAVACNPCQAPALACNPCAQTQTVSYVPQTSYRCQSVTVPVTSYQPVQACDRCSGLPVTSYRPVTSFVQQTRMVPYTSYRLVYTNRPCVTCLLPAAATTTYVPSTTYVPTTNYQVAPAAYTAPAACPTCPGGTPSYGAATGAPSLLSAPAYNGGSPYPAASYGAPTYGSPSAMPSAPAGGYPAAGTPSTFATPPATSNYAPATSGYAAPPYYNPGYTSNGSGYASGNPGYAAGAQAGGANFAPPPPASQPAGPPASPLQNNVPPSGAQQPLKPIPDQNMTPGSKVNSSTNLQLVDPDNRTTSAPNYPAWDYTPVAWASANTQTSSFENTAGEPINTTNPVAEEDNAWRPSNR